MNVITLIKRDHDEVVDLFDHLVVLTQDDRRPAEAAREAARLVAALRIHSRSEENVFYPALLHGAAALKAYALAAAHEHESLDTTLDKLLACSADADCYATIVKVARDLFESHARDEEEADILPLVEREFDADQLTELASAMVAEQAKLRPQMLRLVGMHARAA